MTEKTKVAVVTGASSGIGKVTAIALAEQGWRVIAVGRDPARSAAAEVDIQAASTGAGVDMLQADLSLLSEAARLAGEIAALTDRIDLLVNNAGGTSDRRVVTAEGLEENFAGNHLGPFLLTMRLLPLLRAAAAQAPKGDVRIIATSSIASEYVDTLDFEDMEGRKEADPGLVYCRGKLANLLFTRGLARLLAADGIVAHAVHPGTVGSNFFSNASSQTLAHISGQDLLTPEQGADTIIWLATSEEGGRTSGGYFHERAPRALTPCVENEATVERLWDASEALIRRKGY